MKKLKNNEGTIVQPTGGAAGNFSIVPNSILLDLSLSPTCRLILAYLVGKPSGWTACVTNICDALGLSESAWRIARNQLRAVGLIPFNHPKRLGAGGEKYTWVMDVFLEKYFRDGDLSTVHASKIKDGESKSHPTKTKDGFHPSFPMDGKVGDKQKELNKKKKQQQEKNDVVVFANQVGEDQIQKQDFVDIVGFTPEESQEINKALYAASAGQREAFCIEVAAKSATGWAGIRNQVGWAMSMAKKASIGLLGTTRTAAAAQEQATATSAAEICAEHSGRRGQITGPGGPIASAAHGQNGQLRNPAGVLFSITDSAKCWREVGLGELDFESVS